MPRGFLVKRCKRTSLASYRMREADSEPPKVELSWGTPEERAGVPIICSDSRKSGEGSELPTGVLTETEQVRVSENAEKAERCFRTDYMEINISSRELGSPGRDASYSPIKPVGSEQGTSFFERCLSSPATAESFPSSAPVTSMERLFMNHSTFPPSDMKYDTPVHLFSPLHRAMKRSYLDPERKGKLPAKKPKVTRKLSFEDEVTTSPVLGLKIKKEGPESKISSSVRRKPLGEFICQLCKEEYPDPFSLAQHKCSRIVRVEYRCPECDKVFSCPANLASHRRWHKPRSVNHGEGGEKKPPATVGQDLEKQSLDGKENASDTLISDQHQSARDSSQLPVQQRRTSDAHRQDHKKPQEQSGPADRHYKAGEKCLNTHHVTGDGSVFMGCSEDGATRPYLPSCPPEEVYECRYCDKKFRRQAYLRKHIACHETMRSSYNQIESGQITFPCHLCGAHFPSVEIRDKHRLWHAVREDLLVNPTKAAGTFTGPDILQSDQQIFTCKHCPSTFFSSPGLTRHINKAHPTENRQVMLLQMTVRPGC